MLLNWFVISQGILYWVVFHWDFKKWIFWRQTSQFKKIDVFVTKNAFKKIKQILNLLEEKIIFGRNVTNAVIKL